MVLSCCTNFTGTYTVTKLLRIFLLARKHFIPPPSTSKDVRLRRPFAVAPHVHTKRCVSDILIALLNVAVEEARVMSGAEGARRRRTPRRGRGSTRDERRVGPQVKSVRRQFLTQPNSLLNTALRIAGGEG